MKPVGQNGVSHNPDIFEPGPHEAPRAPKKGHTDVDKFTNPDVQAHVDQIAELTARCVQLSTQRAQVQSRMTMLIQKLEALKSEIQALEKKSAALSESIDLVSDQMAKHGRQAGKIIAPDSEAR